MKNNIQQNCQHKWRKIFRKNPDVNFYSEEKSIYPGGGTITMSKGVMVLEEKVCRLCGLKETKPEGEPTKVCHVCWSEMEYEGATHMIFGTIHHMYKCTNPKCHNTSYHT